ncbi:MAG: peptidylprolyl isomerase [Candidatus Omnitrophica bacterium]|nr:peptidylprolyl isomerase [Candidatus Omnitrophota bacterium]
MKFLTILLSLSLLVMVNGTIAEGKDMMIENGKTVKFDYTLTVEGQVVDTSEGKEPLEYVQGSGNIIPGLEKQMVGLKAGDSRKLTVDAKEAYGEINPELLQEVSKSVFPPDLELKKGMMVPLQNNDGQPIPAIVEEVKEESVVFNFNHPLAGQNLLFDVKVVDVK